MKVSACVPLPLVYAAEAPLLRLSTAPTVLTTSLVFSVKVTVLPASRSELPVDVRSLSEVTLGNECDQGSGIMVTAQTKLRRRRSAGEIQLGVGHRIAGVLQSIGLHPARRRLVDEMIA